MRCSIKLTIHFFFISTQTNLSPHRQNNSENTVHPTLLSPVFHPANARLYGHPYFTKLLHFSQTLTITFLFREVPVKLLLRLLQVFFLHIHLRQNTQGPMFSTIF